MRKRVVNIVLNSFENDARVFRTAQLGKSLVDGVTVLALHESNLKEKETVEGIEVVRLKLTSRNLPKRSFFQLFKFLEFNLRVLFYLIKLKPTVVHAHDLSTLPIGFIYKLISKAKLIYDSHELFLSRSSKVPFIKQALFLEKYMAKKSNLVITVSESIADILQEEYKLSVRPLVIRNVPNYLEIDKSKCVLRKRLGLETKQFVLIYQGGVQLDRGIELLIKAVDVISNPNITLVIIGNGHLREKLLKSAGVSTNANNIIFQEAVPHKELHYWTMDGDIGLSPIIGKSLSYKYCLPNKVFEYVRAGLPLLVSDLPDMKRTVEKYGVGICFKENDLDDLVININKLYNDSDLRSQLRQNSELAAKTLNWETESEILKRCYLDLIA